MDRYKRSPLYHILISAVAIIYVITGLRKIFSLGTVAADFESWGYHPIFLYVFGVIEIAGAVALMIPRARIPGMVALGIIMLGAIATHLYAGEYYQVLLPLTLLLLLASLFVMSQDEIQDATLREHDQANY